MTDATIAAPDTLLGRLQRGRGQGYLDALAVEPSAATSSLLQCITQDPRTDQQVESRGEYYGRIAFDAGMDITHLQAFLFEDVDQNEYDDFRSSLALEALAWMARLGRDDATTLLRRYVEIGKDWSLAIDFMASGKPVGLDGLDKIVVGRCSSIEELALEIWPDWKPWREWRATNASIREAVELKERWARERATSDAEVSRLPTEDLIAQGKVGALQKRTSAVDKAKLLAAARGESDQLRRVAIVALGRQRDLAVLDEAEGELRRHPEKDSPPNAGWIAVMQLLKLGPIERIRGWIGEEGKTGQLAIHMVADWPAPTDAPLMRSVLERLGDDDWLYRICDAADALARLADTTAAPQLERVFRETTYSYLRRRAARALAVVSDRFAQDLAIECLWDCEEETRAIGCATAAWSSSRARERIAEIASDRLQARSVRGVAMRRQSATRIPPP